MPMPSTVLEVRKEESRVFLDARLRVRDLSDITPPISAKGIAMLCPGQDLKCVAYDVWEVVQDLLNDGDHHEHAVFKFKPEFDNTTNERLYSEVWTGDWWQRQQIRVGMTKNIMAIIPFVDETPVTFNGRNMHPMYLSLGNLHASFRLEDQNIYLSFSLTILLQK
jgi:hypothetical protein